MSVETTYLYDKRHVQGDPAKKTDYGWRFQGKTVLLHEDASIIYDDSAAQMEAALRETSMEFFFLDRCLQCGMCTTWCPNSLIPGPGNLSPRELVQQLRLGLLDLSGQELWFCTNCGGCTTNCPYEIPLIDVIISLRRLALKEGAGYVPASLKRVLSSVKAFGNPYREEQGKRAEWLKAASFQPVESEGGVLLFVGCSSSYDPRATKIARSAVRLLGRMGIAFDVLGEREACCGDGVRRVGDQETYDKLRTTNKSNIEARKPGSIYALSPHCAHAMKTGYFENDAQFAVKPFVLLLHDAIEKGALAFTKTINKKATYHDPCFLAKHGGIHEEPREILRGIEGLEVVEMKHNRCDALCCGGGGGGVWLDRKKGERLAEARLEEALASGADILVTSCPFCLSMMEDAAKNDERCSRLRVMDLCELACEAL
jgi:Fe-S oxidoreductase